MAKRNADTKSDPYESNEYLLLRAGSAESGDPKAANLLSWINRDFEKLQQSITWKKPRHKAGYIYPNQDRYNLPTVESVKRVVKLIEAFAAAGAMLETCLEKWPDRDFDDPPPELLAAYRPVNRMLHAYRGEYGIETHPKLRQPALDKYIPKEYLKAEIREARTLDIDKTAGLLLGFVLTGKFPFGEQQAVADLLSLIQTQRFHLLRRCPAPVASHRGERETKEIRSCSRWFLAIRIDQKFCCPRCKNRYYENNPEARNDRRIRANKYYHLKKRGVGAFSKPKSRVRNTDPIGLVKPRTRA